MFLYMYPKSINNSTVIQ